MAAEHFESCVIEPLTVIILHWRGATGYCLHLCQGYIFPPEYARVIFRVNKCFSLRDHPQNLPPIALYFSVQHLVFEVQPK